MNQQLKSHWRLAFRTLKKAIWVTVSLVFQSYRANIFIMSRVKHLERQRELFGLIDQNSEEK